MRLASQVNDVEPSIGGSDLTSLLAWLVVLHIFTKSFMSVSYTVILNLAMFFLMMIFSQKLLILAWRGSYLMIIVIWAQNLQEHCKFNHADMTLGIRHWTYFLVILFYWAGATLLQNMQSMANCQRRWTLTALVLLFWNY